MMDLVKLATILGGLRAVVEIVRIVHPSCEKLVTWFLKALLRLWKRSTTVSSTIWASIWSWRQRTPAFTVEKLILTHPDSDHISGREFWANIDQQSSWNIVVLCQAHHHGSTDFKKLSNQ